MTSERPGFGDESGVSRPEAEQRGKFAGDPRPEAYKDIAEYERSRGIEHGSSVDRGQYPGLLSVAGVPSDAALNVLRVSRSDGRSDHVLDCRFHYAGGVDMHELLAITEGEEEDGLVSLDDILFVDQGSGRVFSMKSLVPAGKEISIDPSLRFRAWGRGPIRLPPPGREFPPRGFLSRALWNTYKKVEPLVLFHEIAHTRQGFNFDVVEESVEAERDAWRFGLQCVRRLRAMGIDPMPGVTNEQMMSRLELLLLSYDKQHPGALPKRFSRISGGNKGVGRGSDSGIDAFHDMRSLIKVLVGVAKTVIRDPSLMVEALSYRGKK